MELDFVAGAEASLSQTPNRSLPAGAPVLIQVPVVNADALSGFAAPIAPVNLVSITA